MTKKIYVIKNNKNKKEYIGQSVNPVARFAEHKRDAKRNRQYKSALYDAMNKYGEENFFIEILEDYTEEYNEREIYWIDKRKTLTPNGYNILPGGEDYPHPKGAECYQAQLSNKDIAEIIELLREDTLAQKEIAARYNIKQSSVSRINLGNSYFQEGIQYPIRERYEKDSFLSQESLDNIIFLLETTEKSLQEIADENKVVKSTINNINQGKSWRNNKKTYPIRKNPNRGGKLSFVEVEEIIVLLNENKLTTQEIGEKYGVLRGAIEQINNGKSHKRDISYPIRKGKTEKNLLTEPQVSEIIFLLQNTEKSLREIARKYNVVHNVIIGIKNGTTKSYRRNNLKYPLR